MTAPTRAVRPALKLMDITLVVRMAAPTLAEAKEALSRPDREAARCAAHNGRSE